MRFDWRVKRRIRVVTVLDYNIFERLPRPHLKMSKISFAPLQYSWPDDHQWNHAGLVIIHVESMCRHGCCRHRFICSHCRYYWVSNWEPSMPSKNQNGQKESPNFCIALTRLLSGRMLYCSHWAEPFSLMMHVVNMLSICIIMCSCHVLITLFLRDFYRAMLIFDSPSLRPGFSSLMWL